MKSVLWNGEEVRKIISPDFKFEEDCMYVCAYYESKYGDIIINNFKFAVRWLIPLGAQFRVSMYEPFDYNSCNTITSVFTCLDYKILHWLHGKNGYHISGFESIGEYGVIESYVPRHFSNRTEYYIDGKYVGVNYSKIYHNEIVRLNNEWLNHVTDILITKRPFVKKIEN